MRSLWKEFEKVSTKFSTMYVIKIQALKRDDALHINTPDPMYCKTALHYAVENGNHDCVRFLLDNGADPNARDIHDKQPGYYGE